MRYAHVRELDRPLFELKERISSVLYKVDSNYENIESPLFQSFKHRYCKTNKELQYENEIWFYK